MTYVKHIQRGLVQSFLKVKCGIDILGNNPRHVPRDSQIDFLSNLHKPLMPNDFLSISKIFLGECVLFADLQSRTKLGVRV